MERYNYKYWEAHNITCKNTIMKQHSSYGKGKLQVVRIEKIEVTKEKATYKYFPEDSSEFGVITFFRMTGKRCLVKELPGYDSKYYCKAMNRIVEYNDNGYFPQKGMIAWY